MPKINKLREIKAKNNLLIQKAQPLSTLSETSMTLTELKILDLYLSRINSHDLKSRHVQFAKGEMEGLLGVTKINQSDLEERINNLFQVLTIKDKNKENGFTKIALFTKAECIQSKGGYWTINLSCSEEAIEYFFNVENIGYLKYRLKNIIELTSRYSYVMYLFLENNRFRGEFTIPLDELKEELNVHSECYEQFKRFNYDILKKCHEEINKKTTLKYSYEPLKQGRYVNAIKFTIKSADEAIFEQKQIEKIDELNENADMANNDLVGKIHLASKQIFSQEEIEEIINTLKTSKIPERIIGDDQETRIYNFFVQVFGRFEIAKQQNSKIKNPYSYFKKMIESEIDQAVLKAEDMKKNEDANSKKSEQSYDINEFKKFSVTFSGNTKKVEDKNPVIEEWKKKIEEVHDRAEAYSMIALITFDEKLDMNEKMQLNELLKDKI